MALTSAIDLRALHSTSSQISNCIKNSTKLSDYGPKLWESPQYALASSKEFDPKIPSPEIFQKLDSHENCQNLPSIAECAVHLEFLAALHELRLRVLESEDLDKLFDIKITKRTVVRKGVNVELKDDTLSQRRQVKWEKFVDLAVVRFLAWWKTGANAIYEGENQSSTFPCELLPPLDVLMVWHSFLLNPRWFRNEARRSSNATSYQVEFPWPAIHKSINPDNWSFTVSGYASSTFKRTTSLESDLFNSLVGCLSYPLDIHKDLLQSVQSTLTSSDAETLLRKVNEPEQRLLRCCIVEGDINRADLRDAVLRQTSFVDKMWDKLWIRSPSLDNTIRKARVRYNNFLHLFKLYPTTMFVPTLDIDLIWHTHQCSQWQYAAATKELAGKFVNHDDSIVQGRLDSGLQDTKSLYRMRFGQEYHICGCWDCEALQSTIEKAGKGADWGRIAKEVGEEVAYYRAVEVARRKGQLIPIRSSSRD